MRWSHLANGLLVALAWSSNAVTAHPTNSTSHPLEKRLSPMNIECAQSPAEFVWHHLKEVEEILDVVIQRTQDLYSFLNGQPTIEFLNKDENEVLLSTFNTFTSIYGKFFWGSEDSKSKDGKDRVKKVLENFSAMKSRASTGSYISNVEIRCDDTWLSDVDQNGQSSTNPLWYFDSRHPDQAPPGPDKGWIDFNEVKGACRDAGHKHYAWVNDKIHGTDESVLSLCQDFMDHWLQVYYAGNKLPTLRQQEYSPLQYKLDDFSGPFLSTALIHELTHVSQIFGSPPTKDQPCVKDGKTVGGYGWFCITQIASSSTERALLNADSYAYYAVAMYFNKNDWSTGNSEALTTLQHRYIALKIYITSSKENQEVRVQEHLSRIKSDHPGSSLVRKMIDKFELTGPSGTHQCVVHEPLLTSLLHFQATLDPSSLPEDLLKGALQQLLLALVYLHSEAHVVHTDIQAKNIIISAKDDSVFREWDDNQAKDSTPRKVNDDYTLYLSRPFDRKKGWSGFGVPLISDFGEARLREVHEGLIQPDIYRAPEIWDLIEDHHLFDGRGPDGRHSDTHLLVEMVAMLGSPSSESLRKSPHSSKYWDPSGQWTSSIEIPENSLEYSEEYLEGENKEIFLQFVRKMLQWDPEERQSARELLTGPWLTSQ
ncbi:uncharacterized protein KD926_009208 [Aspergillus affinis]|uniref:uncharacterized protein n=1 Tax=Aspergillus affinis TaxID=1070780 RepID=UPI0022FEA6EB|nr:uncharacterized protein KD926_009208 [Aspergillus affinis]KAI9039616.1 hypothetical protein KD926_009208 [Aspergillus affinis]